MSEELLPYNESNEKLYRYEEHATGDAEIYVTCHEYPVIKKTKCCAFIQVFHTIKRVQLRWNGGYETKKKFACISKEEALEHYKTRKKYQIQILERKLEQAKLGLEIANSNELTKQIISPILFNQILIANKNNISNYY